MGGQQNGPDMVEGRAFPKNHQGHGGFTIASGGGHSGIAGMITNSALDNYHPHIVLLMIGTNDINGNFDVAGAPGRLRTLVGDITSRAPDTLVVVASIVPVIDTNTDQRVVTYNTAIEEVVNELSAQGDHVAWLDNYAAVFQTPNWQSALMADNLHPNDAGYAVLGRSFYEAITPYLPSGD